MIVAEFKILRKYCEYVVRFEEDQHHNPNIDRKIWSMTGFDVDHRGVLYPDWDGRYNKQFETEEKFRAAIKRMEKKAI